MLKDLDKLNSIELKRYKTQLLNELKEFTEEKRNANVDFNSIEGELKEKQDFIQEIDNKIEELEKRYNNKNLDKQNSTMNEKRFLMIDAINNVISNRHQPSHIQAVIDEAQRSLVNGGGSYNGQIQLPTDLTERSVVSVSQEGENIVSTEIFDVVSEIQKKNILVESGLVRVIPNLKGNVKIPVGKSVTSNWGSENAEATEGANGKLFSSIELKPKRLTTYVDVSKQMLLQSSFDMELYLRNLMVESIQNKINSTILGDGAGDSDTPKGLFSGADTQNITDFASLVDMEAGLDDSTEEKIYLLSNKAKASLRGMAKGNKSTQLVYENGQVDGTTAFNTSHIADKKLIYAVKGAGVLGIWNGIDITIDNLSRATYGEVRLVLNFYADYQTVRTDAIKFGTIA